MSSNFEGDEVLLKTYNDITSDLNKAYSDGICICFAGAMV